MSAKVYILLDLVNVDSEQVARTLRSKSGVTTVDVLEGPPDLLVVIEAPQRQKAGECLMETHRMSLVSRKSFSFWIGMATSCQVRLGRAGWGCTEIWTNAVTHRAQGRLGCVKVQSGKRDFLNVSAHGRSAKRS